MNGKEDAVLIPSLADLRERARVVSLPMRTRFRGIGVREAMLIEGPRGWAEFSPFAEYDDAEAATWLVAAIDYAWNPQPAPVRERIGVNATVPAVAAAEVAGVVARFPGCRTAKVKVAEPGQRLADDVARVREVREVLGPEGRIRIDANGAWGLDEAERAIHVLAEFDLEYAEQPCASIDELAQLRRRVKYMGIPIAADESVRKAADPIAVARADAADLLVIKAQPLGGIARALAIVTQAGLPAVVSSALDTAIGIGQGLALAACLPQLDYDCGLATSALFHDDVAPLGIIDGALEVTRPAPEAARLETLEAPTERRQWWLERLTRCHAVLSEQH